MLDEPVKQYTIPTADELEAIADRLHTAVCRIDELHLGLLHSTGGVETPLSEFAKAPTLEDIGALYSFTSYVEDIVAELDESVGAIREMLPILDLIRRQENEAAER